MLLGPRNANPRKPPPPPPARTRSQSAAAHPCTAGKELNYKCNYVQPCDPRFEYRDDKTSRCKLGQKPASNQPLPTFESCSLEKDFNPRTCRFVAKCKSGQRDDQYRCITSLPRAAVANMEAPRLPNQNLPPKTPRPLKERVLSPRPVVALAPATAVASTPSPRPRPRPRSKTIAQPRGRARPINNKSRTNKKAAAAAAAAVEPPRPRPRRAGVGPMVVDHAPPAPRAAPAPAAAAPLPSDSRSKGNKTNLDDLALEIINEEHKDTLNETLQNDYIRKRGKGRR